MQLEESPWVVAANGKEKPEGHLRSSFPDKF